MTSTLNIFDLESTNLKQSLTIGYGELDYVIANKLMFIKDDKWILAVTMGYINAIDLATERVMEKKEICKEGTTRNPMMASKCFCGRFNLTQLSCPTLVFWLTNNK